MTDETSSSNVFLKNAYTVDQKCLSSSDWRYMLLYLTKFTNVIYLESLMLLLKIMIEKLLNKYTLNDVLLSFLCLVARFNRNLNVCALLW